MSLLRRTVRAAAVFLGASLAFLVVAAQIAPGWRSGQNVPPLDPQPRSSDGMAQPQATDRQAATVPRRDGSSAAAWIVTPHDPPGPVPGVVLVHGAGTGDRDSMLAQANALAAAGVAAITYDKRDDDYSYITRDYPQLADDVVDAAKVLAEHRLVDSGRVGMLGHSEGGWITPLAAQRAPRTFDFLILSSPTIATPLEEVVWIVDARLAGAPEWLRRVPSAALSGGRAFINYLDTDTSEAFASLSIPVYAVWGAKDGVSPVAASVHRLSTATTTSAPVTTVILPGAGHDLDAEAWIPGAAAWVEGLPGTAAREQRTGVEPERHHGITKPHDHNWILNPFGHAAAALLLAIGSFFLPPIRLIRRGRETTE